MQLIRHLAQILNHSHKKRQASVLTIGNFDGIHLGHEKILAEVVKIAQEKNLQSAILTFEPHPVCLFKPEMKRGFRITTLAQKLKIFCEKKINNAAILPFNRQFANLSAQEFIKKILVDGLNVKYLVIGYDFIFGKNREGNLQMLEEASVRYGFNIINIAAQGEQDTIFSSSLIRKLLQEGKINQANQILGRNFAIEGFVINGKKLGNTIGFPTANLKAKPQVIVPKFGVYKVDVSLPHLQKNFAAIMNFGLRPTVSQTSPPQVLEPLYEIHIFNFDEKIHGSLYGKKMRVELQEFIRAEKKFPSLDALREQIRIDCINAQKA